MLLCFYYSKTINTFYYYDSLFSNVGTTGNKNFMYALKWFSKYFKVTNSHYIFGTQIENPPTHCAIYSLIFCLHLLEQKMIPERKQGSMGYEIERYWKLNENGEFCCVNTTSFSIIDQSFNTPNIIEQRIKFANLLKNVKED